MAIATDRKGKNMTELSIEQIIEAHSLICKYHGAGSKKRKRPIEKPHHNRGAFKYESENTRIRECAKDLFKWCKRIGIPPVIDWQQLTEEQKPRQRTRCSE